MAQFICEKQGHCCPHEFYNSIEQAIPDFEDGVPCEHLIEVAPVRHGKWEFNGISVSCSECGSNKPTKAQDHKLANKEIRFCYFCGAIMDMED